jgi:hypothetical protein
MMQGAKDGIASRRRFSRSPERFHLSKKVNYPPKGGIMASCPFCHKTVARFRLMDTTYHEDGFVRVAYFTCGSCSQDWSVRIEI